MSINTCGASYQMICGRFSGYQVGTPDAFLNNQGLGYSLETYYIDGVSITYGSVYNRQHVYTYAAGVMEFSSVAACPCAWGTPPPAFLGSDYYCESGNNTSTTSTGTIYNDDLLWTDSCVVIMRSRAAIHQTSHGSANCSQLLSLET